MRGEAPEAQLRKGVLEYCVLALLESRPRYGFELARRLGRGGALIAGDGTIYPLLSRMRREGWVETEWREAPNGPPRRYYRLTDDGQQAVAAFRSSWERFRNTVNEIMDGGGGL